MNSAVSICYFKHNNQSVIFWEKKGYVHTGLRCSDILTFHQVALMFFTLSLVFM